MESAMTNSVGIAWCWFPWLLVPLQLGCSKGATRNETPDTTPQVAWPAAVSEHVATALDLSRQSWSVAVQDSEAWERLRARFDSELDELAAITNEGLLVIPVPVIYFGQPWPEEYDFFLETESAVAMTPGASNFQVVNGQRFFPRQYGPRDRTTGQDMFERDVETHVSAALFVDDWDHYHRMLGEVHCGSAVVRNPYTSWWSQQ